MLSVASQDLHYNHHGPSFESQHSQAYYTTLPYRPLSLQNHPQRQLTPGEAPFMSISTSTSSNASTASSTASMGGSPPGHHQPPTSHAVGPVVSPAQDAAVAQALEIARESPDGASDPTVSKILEQALSHIWGKVQASPDAYVMSRDEFAVFNFFQHRFAGNKTAVGARKRYWDNMRA